MEKIRVSRLRFNGVSLNAVDVFSEESSQRFICTVYEISNSAKLPTKGEIGTLEVEIEGADSGLFGSKHFQNIEYSRQNETGVHEFFNRSGSSQTICY